MSKRKKKRQAKKPQPTKQNKKQRSMLIILLVLLVPAAIGLIFVSIPTFSKQKKMTEPRFNHEGYLSFYKAQQQDPVLEIDLEFADNQYELEKGMMWRRSMKENQGMLFIMPSTEIQSFWMLNTYISLDLLFIDDDLNIVTIRSNTTPESLDQISSDQPARYVLEVLGGFAERHNIAVGDRVSFHRL